jgi:N-acetylmuramoyl-L-alanine amidase
VPDHLKNSKGRRRGWKGVSTAIGLLLLAGGLALLLTRPLWVRVLIALEQERMPFDIVIVDADSEVNGTGALDLASRLTAALNSKSIPAKLLRYSDSPLPPAERVAYINVHRDPVTISLRCRNVEERSATGIATYYLKDKAPVVRHAIYAHTPLEPMHDLWGGHSPGEVLAGDIHVKLLGATRATDRGIAEGKGEVLEKSNGAAVRIEVGIAPDSLEADLLGTDTYRNIMADAIAEGVQIYLLRVRAMAHGQPIADEV